DLPEAEVRHEGALAELGDGCADDGGEGEHRVHQALPELGGAAPGGVEVEGLRVHGHGGEQDVVRLGEGAAGAVLVDRADLQLVRVQAALHDAGPAGVGVVRAHGRASWVSGAVSSVSTWASSSPRATFWPGRTCSRTTPASGAQRVCSIFIASTTSTASPAPTRSPSATSTVVTVPGMGESRAGASSPTPRSRCTRCSTSSRSSPGRPIHTAVPVQWWLSGRRCPSTVTAQ